MGKSLKAISMLCLVFLFSCVGENQNKKKSSSENNFEKEQSLEENSSQSEQIVNEQKFEKKTFDEQIVDGEWSDWSTCSKPCDSGYQYRICNNPRPSENGNWCVGSYMRYCNTHSCGTSVVNNPVDGAWSNWSNCSKACGGGYSYRACDSPAPKDGGKGCTGSSMKSCNTQACVAVVNGGWSNWSDCSKSCGGGKKRRSCTSPLPSGGGRYCVGDAVKKCNSRSCNANNNNSNNNNSNNNNSNNNSNVSNSNSGNNNNPPPQSGRKTCSEQTIRNALRKHKYFDYDKEGCTNSVVKVSKGIQLTSGMTVDGKNKLRFDWTGVGSGCDEIPRPANYATFYTTGNNNVIKNFTIIKSPEGIHIATGKNNRVENIVFERICEDGITNGNKGSNSATGTIISNVTFKNGPDKAFQCNGGEVTIQYSSFSNIPRSIGACTTKADPGIHAAKPCPTACHIKAYHNKVDGCRGYAFRSGGKSSAKAAGTLIAIGNEFKNCTPALRAEESGYTYGERNKIVGKCSYVANTNQSAKVELCNNDHSCSKLGSGNVKSKCKSYSAPSSGTVGASGHRTINSSRSQSSGNRKVYKETASSSLKKDRSEACQKAKSRAVDKAEEKCRGNVQSYEKHACSCSKVRNQYKCKADAELVCIE